LEAGKFLVCGVMVMGFICQTLSATSDVVTKARGSDADLASRYLAIPQIKGQADKKSHYRFIIKIHTVSMMRCD
jgi:hypothetical protein